METGSRDYNALHKRIGRNLQRPDICENCARQVKLQWAHVHGAPFADARENWRALCSKCHSAYDISPEQRREIARLGGLTAAGIPRHSYGDEFRAKCSATHKARGIKPPSRKGSTNRRIVCKDCGVEYGSNWLNRHKAIGRCMPWIPSKM